MTAVHANGITIEYEESGPRDAPAIVLIMGLGMQLVAWSQSLCEGPARRGFHVIRFDNRDAGLSSKMTPLPRLVTSAMLARALFGLPVQPPFSLNDMASDTLGLLDALGLHRAHLVGASMGGMIAQIVAIERPDRVASLTSIMSSSGNRSLPGPQPKVLRALLWSRSRNPEVAVRRGVLFFRMVNGSGYPASEAELSEKVELAVRRSYRPDGLTRQLLAVLTAPSRAPALRRIRTPTLVLHGDEDPLVPMAAGKDVAANISGARLRIIKGMGHFIPEALIPVLVDEIAEHCIAAEDLAHDQPRRAAGGSP
jgi:pimeloyl-ACP methyl ester carboxylesterase